MTLWWKEFYGREDVGKSVLINKEGDTWVPYNEHEDNVENKVRHKIDERKYIRAPGKGFLPIWVSRLV